MTTIGAWVRAQPLAALKRALTVLGHAVAGGGLGAALIWGPLNGARWAVIAGGLLIGLGFGALWARQQWLAARAALAARDARVARGWRMGLLALPLGIVLAGLIVAVVQLAALGALFPLGQDYAANTERLFATLQRAYAYADLKGVDWEGLRAVQGQRAATADDDATYLRAVGALLGRLHDAHTGVIEPPLVRCCFALTAEVEGQALVTVASGAARQAGLEEGALVRAVEGMALEPALALLPPWQAVGSTPWQRRYRAFLTLLAIPESGELAVDFETAAGEARRALLEWQPTAAVDAPAPAALITGERLPEGPGYIRIPTFERAAGRNLVAEFDAALDALLDAPALILDLRGNGGGDTRVSDAMAGRLLAQPFVYGTEVFRLRHPRLLWRRSLDYRVRPRGPVYAGPVVILIDTACMSTAENFLAALVDSGRAQTVGRRTAGSSGNPLRFRLLGGGVARYSAGAFYRLDGRLIEGVGFEPDVPVTLTVEGVRAGRDADLAAALALLGAAAP